MSRHVNLMIYFTPDFWGNKAKATLGGACMQITFVDANEGRRLAALGVHALVEAFQSFCVHCEGDLKASEPW